MIASRVVEEEWANITRTQGSGVGSEDPTTSRALNTALSAASEAASVAVGAAKLAYGQLAGDQQAKQAGREAVFGKSQ